MHQANWCVWNPVVEIEQEINMGNGDWLGDRWNSTRFDKLLMGKLVKEFLLQDFEEELCCLKSELRVSHKVQINSSPRSTAPLLTNLSDWDAASSLSLWRFQRPKGKDSEKTGQWEGKQNCFLIYKPCSNNYNKRACYNFFNYSNRTIYILIISKSRKALQIKGQSTLTWLPREVSPMGTFLFSFRSLNPTHAKMGYVFWWGVIV